MPFQNIPLYPNHTLCTFEFSRTNFALDGRCRVVLAFDNIGWLWVVRIEGVLDNGRAVVEDVTRLSNDPFDLIEEVDLWAVDGRFFVRFGVELAAVGIDERGCVADGSEALQRKGHLIILV